MGKIPRKADKFLKIFTSHFTAIFHLENLNCTFNASKSHLNMVLTTNLLNQWLTIVIEVQASAISIMFWEFIIGQKWFKKKFIIIFSKIFNWWIKS